jgi:hypothetical protein
MSFSVEELHELREAPKRLVIVVVARKYELPETVRPVLDARPRVD